MRVISGISKGHKLKSPKDLTTRPTEDRIKESLFNILGKIDGDSYVLDLFGGSGSIGIEFLSRGARRCVFVDKSQNSIDAIRTNLNHTKLIDYGEILKQDAARALDYLSKKGISFDYIYLDPPFKEHELLRNILRMIVEKKILSDNGLLIVEHERNLILEDKLFGFKKTDHREFGSKSLTFYTIN